MTDSDHVARLRTLIATATDIPSQFAPRLTLVERDIELLRAVLDELEQLRAERGDGAPQPAPALGNAYVNGWYDALAALRLPGWDEREVGWRKFIAAIKAHAPHQPERGAGADGAR